jgi:hypothetical protein
LHVMTPSMPAVALTARLVGADPLGCYQNGGEFLGVAWMFVVLTLLCRQFRLGPRMAVASALVAVFYLATDVRWPRSYGNILLYCWNGKALLWGVLLPWSIFLATRLLRRPSRARWIGLYLAGVCAPGLSGSGLFLFPAEMLCISVAYLLQGRCRWERLRRAALVNAGSLYCLAIVALGLAGVIPRPSNIDVWTRAWPAEWWRDLGLIFSSGDVALRDALLVFVVPWFALPRPLARLAALLGAAAMLIVANPVTGPLWMRIVTPAAYWRFIFLLPLAWYAGLVLPAILRAHRGRLRAIGSCSVAVGALVASAVVWRHSLFWPPRLASELQLKLPWELRLPRPESAFARLAIPYLRGRYVAGPQDVCISIALLDPQARFDAVRGTEHLFANAGLSAEGLRRVAAQRALTQGSRGEEPAMEPATALRKSFQRGVDAVILVDSEPMRRLVTAEFAASDAAVWRPVVAACGYALFLRAKEKE